MSWPSMECNSWVPDVKTPLIISLGELILNITFQTIKVRPTVIYEFVYQWCMLCWSHLFALFQLF